MRRIQSLSIHAAALSLPLAMAACANDSVASVEAPEEYGTIRAASIIPDQVTTAVATAERHTCARSSWGYLKCWGYNVDGQLGIGNNTSTLAPTARVNVGQGRTVRSVAAGRRHTCAILDNNTLKCWGSNWLGQLGIGTNSDTNAPGPTTNLGLFRLAKSVTVGNTHTCAILTDDTVKCWGDNAYGQLGLGAGAGASVNAPGATVFLGAGRTAKSISTHHQHTCAVLDNDTLKCWGQNFAGALGDGTTVDAFTPGAAVNLGAGRSAKSVSAGHAHTCAVLDNDSIKCWGQNVLGSLGTGTTVEAHLPGASVNLGAGRSAMAVTAGGEHTCALLDNSSVKCWGLNASGQLGVGNTTNLSAPGPAAQLGFLRSAQSVATGGDHTCAVLDNSSLKCWGDNRDGQLGLGTTTSEITVPTTVPNLW